MYGIKTKLAGEIGLNEGVSLTKTFGFPSSLKGKKSPASLRFSYDAGLSIN
jgi:hypothetical protein